MIPRQLLWKDVQVGDLVAERVLDVTYKMAIMHVGSGWDYMPGHHDPEYARSQGMRNIFLNTLFHQSFVDQTMIGWAGPRSFIARRKIEMKGQIYPGDRLSGTGTVARIFVDADGNHKVELTIAVRTQDTLACTAEGCLILPTEAGVRGALPARLQAAP
jgi:acyl dehydratase